MSKAKTGPGEDFGICEKGPDRIVRAQNKTCIDFCGKKIGERCDTGCMKKFAAAGQDSPQPLGFHFVSNMNDGGKTFDALVLNDGETLTTLLLPKDKIVKNMLQAYQSHGLTPTETSIVSLVLDGLTNTEIAKRLFICRQTLKTRLNNINKKVPATLNIVRLRRHFRIGT